ncbi:MAG: SDR family NAD(P)-dependent oxidoreductase, partial [Paludibacteraceae bacterium]|nr:SDR family NAD(P)-dependent oxidoreductase [Paludibacteraceae bacterium]
MAKQGSNLILQSRNKSHTEKILSEVKSLGIEAYAVEAELGCEESVRKMLAEIDAFGVNVEIVLNNAGFQIGYRTDYF